MPDRAHAWNADLGPLACWPRQTSLITDVDMYLYILSHDGRRIR